MTDEEKDAARWRWLSSKAWIEGRDGGYTGSFVFPHLTQRDYCEKQHYKSINDAIDAAMEREAKNDH